MKIGVMLRGIDKQGGTGVYAQNLLPHLLKLGSGHQWRLLYQSKNQRDAFDLPEGTRETVLASSNPVYWDQVVVPRYVKEEGLDVLFNTKFTLPLMPLDGTARVMTLHGASWYVIPECYRWWDVLQIRLAMPNYCRVADRLVSNSSCTTKDYIRYVGVPADKISTIQLAPAPQFGVIQNDALLKRVQSKYGLPDRFVLSVAAYDPRKNVPRLIEAFARSSKASSFTLVIVGKGCERYRSELSELAELLGDRLYLPGWVDQKDLPAIYNLAAVFFFPSVYEEFGIPNCEAMACGTPIVTADTAAPPDVVGDAGILVDPLNVNAMASALDQILGDEALRRQLSSAGLERSKFFSWERTASKTLEVLEAVGQSA